MKEPNAREQAFIGFYLGEADLNGSEAARMAGYSEKTAGTIAGQLLKRPHVAAAIQKAMNERSERTAITADAVLQEIGRLAFSNMSDFYDARGALIPPHKLPRHLAAAILEVQEERVGKTVKRKYKLADKGINLERLGKHLKLFTEKLEHSGEVTVEIVRYGQNPAS